MDRRSVMMMIGLVRPPPCCPLVTAHASRSQEIWGLVRFLGRQRRVRFRPDPAAAELAFLWRDEFNGPAGAPPNPADWFIVPARETIRTPSSGTSPHNMGRYVTDQEHVFQDGKGTNIQCHPWAR